MHQWQYGRNTYLHICVSAYLHNNKITKKQEIIIRYHPSENNVQHLKIKDPATSNAYLSICVFSKEITALASKPSAFVCQNFQKSAKGMPVRRMALFPLPQLAFAENHEVKELKRVGRKENVREE